MKKIFTSSDNFPWHGKQRLAGKLPDGANKPLQLIGKSQHTGNPDPVSSAPTAPPLQLSRSLKMHLISLISPTPNVCQGRQQGEHLCEGKGSDLWVELPGCRRGPHEHRALFTATRFGVNKAGAAAGCGPVTSPTPSPAGAAAPGQNNFSKGLIAPSFPSLTP